MMDGMDDLVQFLRARLDEDEQTACAAAWDEDMAARWTAASSPYGGDQGHPRWYVNDAYDDGVIGKVDPQGNDDEGVARHIARHDPARVLAEADAKRQLFDEHPNVNDGSCGTCVTPQWGYPTHGGSSPQAYPCTTLRLLALPYADHPDYRDTWRP